MKVEKIATVEYHIVLNEEQAEWLKEIMQNPFNGVAPQDEDPYDKEMRYKLFHELVL